VTDTTERTGEQQDSKALPVGETARKVFLVFSRRHLAANLFTLMVLVLGVVQGMRIQRDVFPEVNLGEMIITTRYPGASPRDVELNVTDEIEDEIEGVAGIEEISSYSMENLSVITVTIDIDADDEQQIEDEVRRAVDRVVDLPPEVDEEPRVETIESQDLPILEVGVAGDLPYETLRTHAARFERALEDLPGVAELDEIWYLDREVRIEVSPARMDSLQVALDEVVRAVAGRNVRSTGGELQTGDREESVVTQARFESPEEIARVPVRAVFSGPVVRVGDVAEIVDGYEEARTMSRIDGLPAVTFAVVKDDDADVIRVADRIRDLAERFELEELPDGARILFSNDQSTYVRNRFAVVIANGLIGLALVLVVLTVFLNMRTAFWVAIGIPVVLLGVVFLLPAFGRYLDIITLAAMLLVIGLIVDDAIIVSENTVRRHALGVGSGPEAAAEGIAEVFRPVLTTLLTTFLAFAPIFFMPGVTGQFITVIPLVVSLALALSLAEIVFALPAHLAGGLDRLDEKKRSTRPWFDPIRGLFVRFMRGVLWGRYVFVVLSAALLAIALWYATTHMRFILFPATSADSFVVYVDTPVGSSLEHTSEKVTEIESLVAGLSDGELESFASRIGSHGRFEPGENEHWAFVRVNLTPYPQRERTAAEIVSALRDDTDELEGFADIFYKVVKGGPPVGRPVTLRVIGHDPERRRALSDSVVAFLESIEGVRDIDRNDRRGPAQIRVDLDQNRLARRGLTVAQVAGTLRLAYEGRDVANVRWGREDVDLHVQLTEEARSDSTQLASLRIPNVEGRLIRLDDVADFERTGGPSRIHHFDTDRATRITGDVDQDLITPLQAIDRIRGHFDLAADWPDMEFVFGGEGEETQESFRSLFIAFGVAVIAIYFLLMLLFESVTQPLTIMVAIPFGVLAVIFTFAVHGLPLGFLAMLGLVGLTGVVVNDSLVLVSHVEDLHRSDAEATWKDVVSEGAANRLRPVTMTTLTTSCGLLPLAYGLGGSDPFLAPMALSLGMGLLLATPLSLLLVPCLLMVRQDVHRLFRRGG